MGSPRAWDTSPIRMATPPASDTFVQPEITATTTAAPKEMTVAMQDDGASSSGPSSWDNHVSHLHPFDIAGLLACLYVFTFRMAAFCPCLGRIRQGLLRDGA